MNGQPLPPAHQMVLGAIDDLNEELTRMRFNAPRPTDDNNLGAVLHRHIEAIRLMVVAHGVTAYMLAERGRPSALLNGDGTVAEFMRIE